ncbi:MAG: glutamine--fructose-6-phosphate transaminase (isomerizing) [Fibrobacteres bacterium]|nr:glutamine--fructose-6-phosphate transaminase (isomerizing) [Fibrobacterota bacterium]
MCGIVGYIGKRDAYSTLIKGISRIDYRGYDSAGIAVSINGSLETLKCVGAVSTLKKETSKKNACGTVSIGHTRWATHGKPTKANAHPHLSCDGKIAVVHNGIIENHQALRKYLISEGHKFTSETDTEVIPHLIEHLYEGNLEKAVAAALKQLHGTYGIAVIRAGEKKIVAARKGSPLILGIIGKGEYILASDIAAITEYTKKADYLEDGEICVLTDKGYRITDHDDAPHSHIVKTINWSVAAIEKQGFEHYMLKEIHEQPETMRTIIAGKFDFKNKIPKFGGIRITPLDLKNLDRAIILACGTSFNAGLAGEYFLEKTAGLKTEVVYASEFLCKAEKLSSRDLVIAISQSGETADTLAALRKANSDGAHSIGVVNVVGSTIAREVNSGGLYIHVGPEVGVASTKAYTGQLLSLFLFSLWLGRMRGSLKPAEAEAEMKRLTSLPALAEAALKNEKKIIAIASKFKNATNFMYLGRGIHYATSLEGALKLKEISYIHAEGMPAAEMKHGPIALIDKKMPVVFAVKRDDGYEKIIGNIEEVKARKGIVIAIAEESDKEIHKKADYVIRVPDSTQELSSMLFAIPLQLLAYHIARFRKCEIDKPRNLAKSVTV